MHQKTLMRNFNTPPFLSPKKWQGHIGFSRTCCSGLWYQLVSTFNKSTLILLEPSWAYITLSLTVDSANMFQANQTNDPYKNPHHFQFSYFSDRKFGSHHGTNVLEFTYFIRVNQQNKTEILDMSRWYENCSSNVFHKISDHAKKPSFSMFPEIAQKDPIKTSLFDISGRVEAERNSILHHFQLSLIKIVSNCDRLNSI